MTDKELLEVIQTETYEEDGKTKLACPKAFKIAKQNPVTIRDVGRVCDENEIRLAKCQLGCFE